MPSLRPLLAGLALVAASLLPGPGRAQSAETLRTIFAAADAGDWGQAVAVAAAEDVLVRDLVEWMKLRAGQGSPEEAARFLARRADWPGLERIRAEAERKLDAESPPELVEAIIGPDGPKTGEGVVALARAYRQTGRGDAARALVIEAWTTMGLDETGFDAMIAEAGPVLAPHHAARADMLLWRWRTEDAERLLPLLSDGQRALAEARIALIRKEADAAARLAAVPDDLRDHPGLQYDRYNRFADLGQREAAVAILVERSVSAEALGEPFRWSGWRRSLARWLMREGRPAEAYVVAAEHFLEPEDGYAYADLEWIAGYVALTYLGNPALALDHFNSFEAAVSSPISLGRAGYWRGRALDALGRHDAAVQAYAAAAVHQTGFYGLLAADLLNLPLDPALTGTETFPPWEGSEVARDDGVRAGLLLIAGGERGAAVLFMADAGRRLDRAALGTLGARLAEDDEAFFQVLLGKAAAERGLILPSIYFPLHPVAGMDLPADPALVLSIARRESEFRADAGSGVGALGLMQLMPGTAEEMAGVVGEPYSRGRLTTDFAYNARLGAEYLAYLQAEFGDSPVLIAAGYNAGPSRPWRWIDEFGDPRDGEIDVVDWIEHIEFRETRNYVMRVTESIPVYRTRLAGRTGPLDFRAMLVGKRPVIRPVPRPAVFPPPPAPPASDVDAETVLPASPRARPDTLLDPMPGELAVTRSLRPRGRGGP